MIKKNDSYLYAGDQLKIVVCAWSLRACMCAWVCTKQACVCGPALLNAFARRDDHCWYAGELSTLHRKTAKTRVCVRVRAHVCSQLCVCVDISRLMHPQACRWTSGWTGGRMDGWTQRQASTRAHEHQRAQAHGGAHAWRGAAQNGMAQRAHSIANPAVTM